MEPETAKGGCILTLVCSANYLYRWRRAKLVTAANVSSVQQVKGPMTRHQVWSDWPLPAVMEICPLRHHRCACVHLEVGRIDEQRLLQSTG